MPSVMSRVRIGLSSSGHGLTPHAGYDIATSLLGVELFNQFVIHVNGRYVAGDIVA